MTSESAIANRSFPLWAKFAVVVALICMVSFYVIGLAFIQALQRVAIEVADPQKILQVAKNIAQFPDQLPEGYRYKFGTAITPQRVLHWFGIPVTVPIQNERDGFNFLALEHDPDKQQIVIVSTPQSETKTSEENLENIYQSGLNVGGLDTNYASNRFQARVSKGEIPIAGKTMPYIIGQTEGKTDGKVDEKIEGLVGCISLKDEHRAVLFYGLQQNPGPYDLGETKTLLQSIKGF